MYSAGVTSLRSPPESTERGPLPISGLQGQRYEAGEHYRMHPDFFHIDQAYWPQVDAVGGKRTWAAM
jgi:hypothetical protein